MAIISGSIMALKMLATQGVKQAAMQTAKSAAKNAVKNKAKNFVTGRGKKKGKRGKGGALVKSESGEESVGGGGGGSIVATTPMVGNYRVEQPPQKPDEVGKPTKVSYEAINNQLDSIIALTGVLKKTSSAKMQTAINRRKAERKTAEKEKKRLRESLLEAGKGAAGMIGGALSPVTKAFDPLKFFTNILFGSLLMWIMANGSKITAFLKMALALMNNAGKLLKFGFQGIGKAFKAGLKLLGKIGGPIIKVGRALKKVLGKVGSKIGKAFGKLGRSIANFGLNILNKIKNAGKALLNLPGRAVNQAKKLLGGGGGTKGKLSPNKGLNKLLGDSTGTASRATGTASRATGKLSNATRSIRLKHGDEAARMYQGMIDNGVKPARASKYVNEAISKGKLTSQPLQGLARQTGGSQLLKGGVGRSTNRIIAKVGGKNALKMTKALKGALRRIPIVGPLITLIVSVLDPEVSVNQALFRTAGAVVGGFLGTFIPIPVVGTLMGEIIGEYVGDLTYIAMNGGGVEAVGAKMKEDIEGVLKVGEAALAWAGDGFSRLYEGLPRINLFGYKGLVNFPSLLLNPLQVIPTVYKAFFTREPMEKGKEEKVKTSMTDGLEDGPTGVTNVSTVRRNTEGARAGDFIMASDGTLGVFDGMGTRGLREGEQELFDSGATNVDGSRAPSTSSSSSASNNSGLSGNQKAFLETVSFAEGTKQKGYNTWFGNKLFPENQPDLSQYTINEIVELQKRFLREGHGSFAGGKSAAVGKYQMVYPENFAAKAGLDPAKDKFTPGNQDRMALYGYIMGQGGVTEAEINAPEISDQTIDKLAPVFASFPNLFGPGQNGKAPGDGVSYYPSQGAKYKADIKAQFRKERGGGSQPSATQPQTPNVQPQTPLVAGQKKTAVLAYGTNDWSLSESEIKKRATGLIRDLMSKGYNVVVVPPNKDLNVEGYGKKDAPYRGVYSAAAETGAVIELGKYQTGDTLHLEPADAKRIFNKYKSAIYVGDSNAVRMKASGSGDYSNTATAVSGAGGDAIKEQIDSAVENISSRQATPDNSDKIASQDQSDSDTSSAPAQVTASPSVQSQMSSGISGISQNLPYQQVGGQQVVMVQSSGGQQLGGVVGGQQGSMIMMGSQQVLNSYHKSQILGFLYKQG